ncbi:MAG: type II secretion system protein [Chloroflexi bacterium]|nr:type II secretion system protein [Chloroflexota bacterium]
MRGQRGFTVVELLIAVGVAGALMPLVVSSIFQIIKGTDHVNSKTIVLADVNNASTWINRDLPQGEKLLDPATLTPLVNCATGTQPSVRAEWSDKTIWGAGDPLHFAEYRRDPGTTLLQRNYDGAISIVGRYVTNVSFCQDADGLIRVSITSTEGRTTPISKGLSFLVSPRTGGTP